METRRTVGWNIRRLRVLSGLSMEELAHESEVDASSIGRIERGTMNVSIDLLDQIARVLKVRTKLLFEDIDKAPAPLRSGRGRKKKGFAGRRGKGGSHR
jgi:transcriptional regulator with XRE-family HTH domain